MPNQPIHSVTERGGLMWLFLLTFMLFGSTFAHMVIAGMHIAETAGNIANTLFALLLLFCGVIVPPQNLSGFWIFMYRVPPFTYLIDGIMSTALANTGVVCADNEISIVNPPMGQTCGQYLASFISFAKGMLANPDATSFCRYCPDYDTNLSLSIVGSHYHLRWRNFSIMWAFITFNFVGAFVLYWLFRVPKGSSSRGV
ncbi:Multidrug resistance protein [Marasmius tenuissimus]|nr:Multidrug resistance protein [Marasmius tenuissimus]